MFGEEAEGEHLFSWRRNLGRTFVKLEKRLSMNVCLAGEEIEGERLFRCRRNLGRTFVKWVLVGVSGWINIFLGSICWVSVFWV